MTETQFFAIGFLIPWLMAFPLMWALREDLKDKGEWK